MKTKSTFFSLLFAVTLFAILTNCSGNKKEAETHHHHDEHASGSTAAEEPSEPQFQADQKFQQQLGRVFTAYVELKNAFVSSDVKQVKEKASDTQDALNKVDMTLLSGAAHNDWMNYRSPLQISLREIQSSDDLETQRRSFSVLSDNLYKSIRAYGLGGTLAYHQYCPMAFSNEGAYWLSNEEQIRNPYFGNKMLTCGEVREKLK